MTAFLVAAVLLLSALDRPGSGSSQPLASAADWSGLFDLRASLGLRSRDWPRKADPCGAWTGVECRFGRVAGLNLSGLRRTRLGRMNPRFAVDGLRRLDRLEYFNSTGFALPGPLPDWFGSQLAPSVSILVLRSSAVNGTIPFTIGQLGNLTVLDLSHNSITGPIPPSIGMVQNLKALILSGNNLTGSLPAQLGDLLALSVLDLGSNSLGEALPDEFKALGLLKELNLSRNNFSGPLPGSILSSELQVLDVSFNSFTGMLPDLAGADPNPNASTAVFNLSNNLYYGLISPGVQMFLQRFGVVDLSGNYFQGSVPLRESSRKESFGLNCFLNAADQRSSDACVEFYRARGVPYDGPLNPNSAPSPSSFDGRRKKKKSQAWKYILGGVFGFVGLVVFAVLVFVICSKRGRIRTADQGGARVRAVSLGDGQPLPPSRVVSKNMPANGEAFTYDQLVRATSELSATKFIKKGHSGDLYHGVLESGFSVVVKRIDVEMVQHEMYVTELDLYARVSHTRLVPLLGQCLEKENEKLLVYKYMPHGDLASALHRKPEPGEEGLSSLDWITRLKIAVGVAEALCFLHHECNPSLVHRDIQARSILLDDKFEVRLGSLSYVCAQEGDGHHNVFTRLLRRSTNTEPSTSGSQAATCTYDIYCFGKVLLELVTGRTGISEPDNPTQAEWLDHTLRSIAMCDKETITRMIDPSLVLDEDLIQEAWATMVIAKACMDPKPSKRPVARHVLKALENPLKVMRLYSRSTSSGLRTNSSWASWHGAFYGSRNHSSSALGSGRFRRSGTVRSQGSLGEHSFSRKRNSIDIHPEPAGKDPGDEEQRGG